MLICDEIECSMSRHSRNKSPWSMTAQDTAGDDGSRQLVSNQTAETALSDKQATRQSNQHVQSHRMLFRKMSVMIDTMKRSTQTTGSVRGNGAESHSRKRSPEKAHVAGNRDGRAKFPSAVFGVDAVIEMRGCNVRVRASARDGAVGLA